MISLPASPAAQSALEIIRRLQEAGHVTYLAGGSVRDLLAGRTPSDYDVATAAHPDVVMGLFPHSILVGQSFGVVRARHHDQSIEVATFRTEGVYADGRRPSSVNFTDAPTDAHRRDFTINAVFFDPIAGALHDYVGGQADLSAGVIRCIGIPDERFAEDHLRLLRAVRFASVLNFEIEPATRIAIERHAPRVTAISVERVRDELVRLLTEAPRPGDGLRLLDDTGLLEPMLPEIVAMKGQAQPPQFHPEGDVFEHTVLMLNGMASPTPELAMAVLLHDVGKPGTARMDGDRIRFNGHASVGAELAETILRRLRFSNQTIRQVCAAVAGHMSFIDVPAMKPSTLRRFVGREFFELEMELHRLDCQGSHGDLSHYHRLTEVKEALAQEPVLPPRWISGHDIMALGVPRGADVGRWLHTAYDAQLEGRFANREALLAWLRQQIKA